MRLTAIRLASCVAAAAVAVSLGFAQSAPPAGTPSKPAAPPSNPPAEAPAPRPAQPEPTYVLLSTTRGDIALELDPAHSPITVKNFVEYVKSGYYNNTVFHRVMPDFMIQGGGFDASLSAKQTKAPIKNECSNGLKNTKGSVAMARLPTGLHTATSQFFINLVDNRNLDQEDNCYAVFGKVIRGMDVVEAIARVKTGKKTATAPTGQSIQMYDVPLETITVTKAQVVSAAEAKGGAAPANPPADPPAGGGKDKSATPPKKS